MVPDVFPQWCALGFVGDSCFPGVPSTPSVTSVIGGAIGDVAKTAGNSVFESIAGFFSSAATAMLNWLWGALDNITSVNLASANVRDMLGLTLAFGFVVALLLACIEIAVSAIYRRPRGIVMALTGLAKTTVGTIAAVSTTQIMLTATDEVCRGFVKAVLGSSAIGLGEAMGISAAFAVVNPAGALTMGVVVMLAVAIIFVAMVLRSTLIILAAVLTPLALAGSASSWTQSWPRKWVEWMVALVISKLLLVIILVLGVKIVLNPSMNGGSWANNVATFGGGVAILLLAGFSPWIAIRLVHFAEGHISAVAGQAGALGGAVSGAKNVAKGAATTGASLATGGAGAAAKLAAGETVVGTAQGAAGGAARGGGGAGSSGSQRSGVGGVSGSGEPPKGSESGTEGNSGTAAPASSAENSAAVPATATSSSGGGGSAAASSDSRDSISASGGTEDWTGEDAYALPSSKGNLPAPLTPPSKQRADANGGSDK